MPTKTQKISGLRDYAADPIRDHKYILEILDLLKDKVHNSWRTSYGADP